VVRGVQYLLQWVVVGAGEVSQIIDAVQLIILLDWIYFAPAEYTINIYFVMVVGWEYLIVAYVSLIVLQDVQFFQI
jgi:hypothetical protein